MDKLFAGLAAVSGFLAVGLGAFGAHGLKNRLTEDMLAVYQTGVHYHFYHTLALLGVGLLLRQVGNHALLAASGWAFIVGMLLFSGSLYVLSITGVRWLGAITPLGGLAFLVAWALLAWSIFTLPGVRP